MNSAKKKDQRFWQKWATSGAIGQIIPKKKFHVLDIITVITGAIVCPGFTDGLMDFLKYLTREKVVALHQVNRILDECAPFLKLQFPQLNTPEIVFEIGRLREMLQTDNGRRDPQKLLLGWQAEIAAKFGEFLEVSPIPATAHTHIGPIAEMIAIKGFEGTILLRD